MAGLALGVTCCLIIFLLVRFELSYDNFHESAEDTYRITNRFTRNGVDNYFPYTPFPTAEALRNDYPELERVTQTYYNFGGNVLLPNNETFSVKNVLFADHEFLNVFDFDLIDGDINTCLLGPGKVVLTESFAKTLFGKENALGKSVELNNALTLGVTGIVADPPDNTHFDFTILVSYKSFSNDYYELDADINDWDMVDNGTTYVVLSDSQNPEGFEASLQDFGIKYRGEKFAEYGAFYSQPLSEIHFDERYSQSAHHAITAKSTIAGFAIIGLILLLAACINFINLSTAQSVTRAKEVGIRKVMGAGQGLLVYQFLSEVLIITSTSVVVAIGLAEAFLPMVNELMSLNLSLNLTDPVIYLFLVILIILVSLLAGLYPGFVMARFKPVKVLRSKLMASTGRGISLRKFLVITQFFIAQVLIISTVVVFNQIDFFKSKSMGFDSEYLINFGLGIKDSTDKVLFKQQLKQSPNVRSVSIFSSPPTQNMHLNGPFRLLNRESPEKHRAFFRSVDEDYIDTYNLELAAGIDIDHEISKTEPGVIVNEALLRKYNIDDPSEVISEPINGSWLFERATIVGVMKDFHNRSLQNEITPLILFYNPDYHWRGSISLTGTNVSETLSHIEEVYTRIFPENTFDYQFENDRLAMLYVQEEKTFTAFQIFSAIAVVICCLGLFGLVSFIANQKIKEVGIRKVLGANILHILKLFGQQFASPLIIAFVIAAPLGYYFMNYWLNEFAYRIEIGLMTFALTALISIVVAGVVVSYHSLKSAKSNPVDALRYE